MALKTYKARSCGMRFRESATFEEITEKKPVKRLTEAVRKTAGRNNQGRITVRHRGGGVKRRIRIEKIGIVAVGAETTDDPEYKLISDQFHCIANFLGWEVVLDEAISAAAAGDLAKDAARLAALTEAAAKL